MFFFTKQIYIFNFYNINTMIFFTVLENSLLVVDIS